MACILCFEDGTKMRERLIFIFSEEGSQLNICSIIAKHFWFKPQNDFSYPQLVCWTCWAALRDFNAFYIRVAELHRTDWKYPYTEEVGSEQNRYPLPQETDLKYEEFMVEGEKSEVNEVSLGAEIKLEVHDYDNLPRAEIFEESNKGLLRPLHSPTPGSVSCIYNNNNSNKESKQTEIKKRRGRPLNNENDTEASKAKSKKLESIEDIDLPAAKLNENVENFNKIDSDANQEVKAIHTNTPSPMMKERNEEVNVRDAKRTKSELPLIDRISDVNDNNVDCDATPPHATGDSESSSSGSYDSDKATAAQYTIIPNEKIVKPKKYRKRSKQEQLNALPRKRTREELDARKAQQQEYEIVIKQFFIRLTCSVCELVVHNFTEMRDHQRFSHNIDPAYIMCCGRKFFRRQLIAEHIYLHWNPEHFKCKTCSEVCTSSRHLREHEKGHADPTKMKGLKKFQCDRCENAYTTKGTLQQHFLSKHIPKSEFKVKCPECDKKFPTKNLCHDHKKKCHALKIVCDKCGKQVRTTYLKKHHELEHSEVPRPVPEPQQCQICGTWLRHMSGLRQHMKAMHEDPGDEHRCQICNKVSTNARALKRHIYLNHECERKFKCTMCEKSFKLPRDLREHTSTHTGEVLYTCLNCPMTFISNANMHKHRQRLHRAEWEADRKKPRHLAKNRIQAEDATAAL